VTTPRGFAPGAPIGADLDLTWLVTHGASMSWEYSYSVDPALEDLESARDEADWSQCVEAAALVLRSVVRCRQVGAGLTEMKDDLEFQMLLAISEDPAAVALRELLALAQDTRMTAEAAIEIATTYSQSLEAELPFRLPVIRKSGQHGRTVRATATLSRLRKDLGFGPVSWSQLSI
jgi:hypothetical protein